MEPVEPERPFGELPAALVGEVLERAGDLGQEFLADYKQAHDCRQEWREGLKRAGLLCREAELPYTPIPTTCGVDGSYAVERLLASDLVFAAAVAVEGLTPPSEARHWPEPRHLVWVEKEAHEAETGTILRALMIGMELKLASQAPHEVIFLDGSFTTPLIYFNQALSKAQDAMHLKTTARFLDEVVPFLEAYSTVLASARSDRCWLAAPKYTTRREIGQEMGWPDGKDDRGLLTFLLEPGEYTRPKPLQGPAQPWHLNLGPLAPSVREKAGRLAEGVISSLGEIRALYYRPHPGLPALRIEVGRAVAEDPVRLATVLHGVRHQFCVPPVMEPYPLYMADRMVKHLPKAIPAFRQAVLQRIAEAYEGSIGEVFLGLHGYRTESGV